MNYFDKKLALILENCSALLLEGFGYKLYDPEDPIIAGDDVVAVREKGEFTVTGPEDYSEEYDFVKITPANEHESFRIKSDPRSLSTFDVEIWYGFDVESPKEFSLDDKNDWDEERKRILDIINSIPYESMPDEKRKDYFDEDLQKLFINGLLEKTKDQLIKFHKSMWRAEEFGSYEAFRNSVPAQQKSKNIRELIEIMDDHTGTVSSLLNTFNKKITKRNKNYLDTIKWAFANLLKHPDEFVDGEAIKNQFIKLGSELFGEKRKIKTKRYAAVLYPQSSSEFNKDFANAIAKLEGIDIDADLVLQLQKTVFSRDIKNIDIKELVNIPELEITGKFYQDKFEKGLALELNTPDEADRRGAYKEAGLQNWQNIAKITLDMELTKLMGDSPSDETIEVSDERWPRTWAYKEAKKLKEGIRIDDSGNIVIHTLNSKNKRRYVRIFSDNYIDIFKGEHILIIDDNVDSQGTLESMHNILVGVSSVDIYVPLNLKG